MCDDSHGKVRDARFARLFRAAPSYSMLAQIRLAAVGNRPGGFVDLVDERPSKAELIIWGEYLPRVVLLNPTLVGDGHLTFPSALSLTDGPLLIDGFSEDRS